MLEGILLNNFALSIGYLSGVVVKVGVTVGVRVKVGVKVEVGVGVGVEVLVGVGVKVGPKSLPGAQEAQKRARVRNQVRRMGQLYGFVSRIESAPF